MIKPNTTFEVCRPDEVAECWDGVSEELYQKLWEVTSNLPNLSEVVDMEECGPNDVIGIHSIASVWDRFNTEEQIELNRLAEKEMENW